MDKAASLRPGLASGLVPQKPIIATVCRGRAAYLWVGNDAEDNKTCYATLSGTKTLRRLARSILKATAIKPRRKA